MVRSRVNIYDNSPAAVKKAIGAAEAATDSLAALAWSEFSVARALGDIGVYANEKVAEHYGDIVSSEVQFGASNMRSDFKRVATLTQADS